MEMTRNLLRKDEILRYLGYQGSEIPIQTERLIEGGIVETLGLVRPKYTYRRYMVAEEVGGIRVEGCGLFLPGGAIRKHLAGCREIYLLCATVGMFVDKNIRLKMVMEPAAGVVLDSCASVAVERVADAAEKQIEEEVGAEGRHITWRFSPGYGDFPLSVQRDIVEELDTYRRLGVAVGEDMLLTPSKSVTALVGVMERPGTGDAGEEDGRGGKCDYCLNQERCGFYAKGKRCGEREE